MADKFLTEANILLEELIGTRSGAAEIDNLLFPNSSVTDGESIRLDEYLGLPTVMRVSRAGMPANSNPIDSGSSLEHIPPTHAERFAITPEMTGITVAGVPSTDHSSQIREMMARQIRKMYEGWLAARRRAAIGLLQDGKVYFYGSSADDYEEADFSRKARNKFTHNVGTNGFDKAIAEAYTRGRESDLSPANLVLLCGKNWLTRFQTDGEIQKKWDTSANVSLMEQNLRRIPELGNVEGLKLIAYYLAAGMTTPVWIASYEARLPFLAKVGGTREPYIADNKAILFSLDNTGHRFYRGVVVNTGYNSYARVAGELVQDTYSQPDPTTQYVRMQSRFFYAMGNVNHAVTITGSNF